MSVSAPILQILTIMQLPQEIIDGILNPEGSNIGSLLQLDGLLHSIFTFDLPKSYFMLLIASASWVGLLILCGLPIFIFRIYRKKIWLIRFIRRQEGVYIVPNAITSFVICITLFGICWIVTCTMEVMAYMMKYDILQNALPAMQIMCWWPLLSAISCVAWGSFFSLGCLDSPKALHRYVPRPFILNILCLGSPFFVGLVQIPLAICCELALRKNLKTYRNFHQRIVNAAESLTTEAHPFVVPPEEGKELLQLAMSTFHRTKTSARMYRASYGFWSILSLTLLIFYAIVGYQLTLRLHQKMRQHYFSLQPSERLQCRSWYFFIRKIRWKKLSVPAKVKNAFSKKYKGIIPRVERRPDSLKLYAYDQEMIGNNQSYVVHPRSYSPFHRLSESVDKHPKPAEIFVRSISELQIPPPTTPNTICQRTSKDRLEMYKYSRRCWISLTILYLSILMALSVFTSTSILWSLQVVSMVNKGPIAMGRLYEKTHLVSAWNCIIFGTTAAFAIISRIFDPAPESMVQVGTEAEHQPRRENDDQYLTAMQVISETAPKPTASASLQPSIHSIYQPTEAVAMEGIGLSYFSMDTDEIPRNNARQIRHGSICLSCDNLDRLNRLEECIDLNTRHAS